jgi:hypothetical protein
MNRMMSILVIGLEMIGVVTSIQWACGAKFLAVPFNVIVTTTASATVVRTRKPTAGLIVAAWLALGPIVTPIARDQLSDPNQAAIFAATILQLLAHAVALASGTAAQTRDRQRHDVGPPQPTTPRR